MGVKGNGGAPQPQGQPPQAGPGAKPPSPQAMNADRLRMQQQAMQRTGGPQAGIAGLKGGGGNAMAQRPPGQAQNLMNQYRDQMNAANTQNKAHQAFLSNQTAEKNFAAGKGPTSMEGMNRADFMPGGALSGANSVGASNPDAIAAQQAAALANPSAAKAAAPAIGGDALARMQDQLGSNNMRDPGAAKMPNALSTMAAMQGMAGRGGMQGAQAGNAKGGGAKGGGGQQRQQAGATGGGGKGGNKGGAGVPQGSRGQYANGGIVGLAGGGQLGGVTGGGVSYGPATAGPPAMAIAPVAPVAPTVAAPVTAAPRWSPVAAPAGGGGGMFGGIGSLAPIAQPAKFVAPATQQAIWQPPAKVEPASTAGAGMKGTDFIKAIMFGAVSPDMIKQMSPQQYTDYRMMGMRTNSGGGNSGRGGQSHGDRSGGYR